MSVLEFYQMLLRIRDNIEDLNVAGYSLYNGHTRAEIVSSFAEIKSCLDELINFIENNSCGYRQNV